jgi:hypothetical protein
MGSVFLIGQESPVDLFQRYGKLGVTVFSLRIRRASVLHIWKISFCRFFLYRIQKQQLKAIYQHI